MYLDVSWCIWTGHIKIHSKYMHDTCTIHRIRILITNVPKFDNKSTVTRATTSPDWRVDRGGHTYRHGMVWYGIGRWVGKKKVGWCAWVPPHGWRYFSWYFCYSIEFGMEFGYICYQDTYPMYLACIMHVSCMHFDVSRSYVHQDTSRYIKIHQDTSRYIKIHQDTSRYIKIHVYLSLWLS